MGTDYAARKAAKKRGKKQGAAEQGDRPKRRSGARRLCTGPCFGVPQLTDDDVAWSDGDADAPPPPQAAVAAAEAAAATLAEVAEEVGGKNKKKQGVPEAGQSASVASAKKAAAPPPPSTPRRRLSTSVAPLPTLDVGAAVTNPHTLARDGGDAVLAGLPPAYRVAIAAFNLASPTRVQAAAWPPAAAGRDVLMLAPPGAGKTLAYLVPVMVDASASPSASSSSRITSLILVPTRELARQVYRDAAPLRAVARCACVYGGASRDDQVARLRGGGVRVVVATPGRLLDLAREGVVDLATVTSIVLDEADKMLAMGLADQIDALRALVASRTPRVTLASATLAPALQAKAAAWLRTDCVRVAVQDVQRPSSLSHRPSVTQTVHVCAEHKKPAKLKKHLAAIAAASAGCRTKPRVLVFCNRIKTVKFVETVVRDAGFKVDTLHGDRSQPDRDRALAAFRAGAAQVLVATDVGGRGLHIPALAYVINYDFPSSLDAYVHRVGRAGRLGDGGHAYSFFTRPLAPLAGGLVEMLRVAGQGVDPNLVRLAEAWRVAQGKEKGEGVEEGGDDGGNDDGGDGGRDDDGGDGGRGDGSDDDDGDDDDGGDDDAPSVPPPTKAVKKKRDALAPAELPGLYKKHNKGRGAGGGDDEESGFIAAAAAPQKAKRALPGRLRKKLARVAGRMEV